MMWHWTSFHKLVFHLYVFFTETSVQIFCPSFNWVIWFFNVEFWDSLHILITGPLSVICSAIFSLSPWLVFLFSNSVFCNGEGFFFMFNEVQFILFYGLCFAVTSKNSLPNLWSARFSSFFSFSKSCIVLHFTFKSDLVWVILENRCKICV